MTHKICRRCQEDKPISAFPPNSRYKDGVGSWCRECHRTRNSSWAKENRARLTAKAAIWRAANPEIYRAADMKHKAANKERLAEKHREWAMRNRGKRNAVCARHKAAKLRATPPWADMEKIKAIYELAARIQKETGRRMHVDHIIPLQHPRVCGLHIHTNLQILPGALNESKKNKWPVEDEKYFTEPEAAHKEPRLFGHVESKPKPIALF